MTEQKKEKDYMKGKIRELKNQGNNQTDIDIDKIRNKLLADDVDQQSKT